MNPVTAQGRPLPPPFHARDLQLHHHHQFQQPPPEEEEQSGGSSSTGFCFLRQAAAEVPGPLKEVTEVIEKVEACVDEDGAKKIEAIQETIVAVTTSSEPPKTDEAEQPAPPEPAAEETPAAPPPPPPPPPEEGHPVCYNAYGEYQNKELYNATFSDEEKRAKVLRWRIQFLERSIRKLDFTPNGVCTMVQVNDLKNSSAPAKG